MPAKKVRKHRHRYDMCLWQTYNWFDMNHKHHQDCEVKYCRCGKRKPITKSEKPKKRKP